MQNAELAYLLGMIAGKGTIKRGNTQTDIIIEIPHKNLISEGVNAKFSVKASLDDIRNILEPLISERLQTSQTKNKTFIKFTKNNEDFLIREINRYFGRLNSCKDFRIPKEIVDSPLDIKREFIIGLSDVTAHIRSSNIAYSIQYHHRVYVEIPVNWFMVIDIGNILYDLDVPIHTINWGHPNMRDLKLKYYKKGQTMAWNKEHQIKIFADEFEKIGFRIVHKVEALKKLAETNRKEWDKSLRRKIENTKNEDRKEKYLRMIRHIELDHHKFYWERKKIEKTKAIHPMENSEILPAEIRGKHFNSWKEICEILGYKRR